MNENTDHEIIDGDEDIENDVEEEMEEHPNYGISIDETSAKPKSPRLLCRSIRIGSFKIHPINDLPHLPVVVSPDGFCFKVSKVTKESDLISITLKAGDIVQVLVHFGRTMPIMYIFTTPACARRIRYRLGMVKGSHLYFDPKVDDEKQKRITLLIDNMNGEMKNYLRNTFPGDGILKEIKIKQANKILMESTPHHEFTNLWQAYFTVKNPADSSAMIENTDHGIIDGDDDIENDVEKENEEEEANEMEEHPNHRISIDETSGKPKSLRLLCRIIRIGSFRILPINDLPHLPVVVTPDGFCFKVPKVTKESDLIGITLKARDIVQVLGHFGRTMPIMYIFTKPACARRIRYQLGMVKGSHLYFDPKVDDEKQKRITLLIDHMNDQMKNYLRNTFPRDGILKEIDQKEANEILVKSTPHHVYHL